MTPFSPQSLEEIRAKLRRGNQILFTRDSECLQPLLSLIRRQSHKALVLWALEGCLSPLSLLFERMPGETRPRQALHAAHRWAQGALTMPAARHAILDAHAAAKDTCDPVAVALCHAVGQACAAVHTETHAIGLAMYELTALVRLYGLDGCAVPLSQKLETYAQRLMHWQTDAERHPGPWAAFLLRSAPNKERLLYEKQRAKKGEPSW